MNAAGPSGGSGDVSRGLLQARRRRAGLGVLQVRPLTRICCTTPLIILSEKDYTVMARDYTQRTEAENRFFELRESGYTGPIDQDGQPVADIDAWIEEHR